MFFCFFTAHFWPRADSCSWMSVHPAVTDPAPVCCASPACTQQCVCAFWHFKKPCGGNVKSLRVRVCSRSCSLGRQCVPCHCASKHTQLPEEKAGPLSPSPPARQSIPPPSPRHSSRSLTRSPVASRCLPVNIYSPLCAGTGAAGRGQRRKPGFALTKCSCPLTTWMICCQEQEAASGYRGRGVGEGGTNRLGSSERQQEGGATSGMEALFEMQEPVLRRKLRNIPLVMWRPTRIVISAVCSTLWLIHTGSSEKSKVSADSRTFIKIRIG